MATLDRPGALLADAFRRILDDLDLAQRASFVEPSTVGGITRQPVGWK
jgi:hypothetical protein